MNERLNRIAIGTVIAGVLILTLGALCAAAGLRINSSRSIPLGLYRTSDAPVVTGAYVIFCPPQMAVFEEAKRRGYISAGFCPGGYGYMMKKILAAKDDVIGVGQDGVRVNRRLLPLSMPINVDRSGRSMPVYRVDALTLSEGQLLLMSDVNPRSFDGRYFGPILRFQVRAVIVPVFTW